MALKRTGMVLAALGCALLVVQPQVGMRAARQGLAVWSGALIPAMFPYCFLAIALQRGGLGTALGRWLGGLMRIMGCPAEGAAALACGWLGGNPTGARLTAICAEQRPLASRDCLRLAWLTSACSPAFALGTLESALPGCGWTLLVSCWAGTLCGSLLLRRLPLGGASPDEALPTRESVPARPAALEAAHSMLLIGCWVVLMSVLAAYMYWGALRLAPGIDPLPLAATHALLEMAGGTLTLAGLQGPLVLPLISFAITFGGLSIAMQSLAMLRPAGVSAAPYLAGKAVQGLLAALVCALLTRGGAAQVFAPLGSLCTEGIADSPAIPAAIALVLGVLALRLNRRFIDYQNADRPNG